jgi:hypothetical protein
MPHTNILTFVLFPLFGFRVTSDFFVGVYAPMTQEEKLAEFEATAAQIKARNEQLSKEMAQRWDAYHTAAAQLLTEGQREIRLLRSDSKMNVELADLTEEVAAAFGTQPGHPTDSLSEIAAKFEAKGAKVLASGIAQLEALQAKILQQQEEFHKALAEGVKLFEAAMFKVLQ